MYSIRLPRENGWSHPNADKREIQALIDAVKTGEVRSVLAEAQKLVEDLYRAVRLNPQAFLNDRIYPAVCCLERAVAKRGAKLEHLGLSKKKVLQEVRRILELE